MKVTSVDGQLFNPDGSRYRVDGLPVILRDGDPRKMYRGEALLIDIDELGTGSDGEPIEVIPWDSRDEKKAMLSVGTSSDHRFIEWE